MWFIDCSVVQIKFFMSIFHHFYHRSKNVGMKKNCGKFFGAPLELWHVLNLSAL